MTTSATSMPYSSWIEWMPPGVNTFSSRILSPTISTPTKYRPSARSLGRISSQMRASAGPKSQRDRVAERLGGGRFGVADGGVAAVDRDPLADADRLGPQQQQPLFALLDFGHVLLRHRVSVLGHRGDHLIQVRDLAPLDQENLLAAARLQRLQNRGAPQGPHPLFELLG